MRKEPIVFPSLSSLYFKYGVISLSVVLALFVFEQQFSESGNRQYLIIILLLIAAVFTHLLASREKLAWTHLSDAANIRRLLDSQKNMIILTDGSNVVDVNRSFLEFFGYHSLDSFKKDHHCVCEFFLRGEGQ